MTLISKAKDLAARAHGGQYRSFSMGIPYIVHPFQVAAVLQTQTDVTEFEIAAAYLHDVLEDCSQRFVNEMYLFFPREVTRLIEELTNPSTGSAAPRAQRKEMDREHFKYASLEAMRIKLIDRTLNLRDMTNDRVGAAFLAMYLDESEALLDVVMGRILTGDIDTLSDEIGRLGTDLQGVISELRAQLPDRANAEVRVVGRLK
jgi:hypothetical protein